MKKKFVVKELNIDNIKYKYYTAKKETFSGYILSIDSICIWSIS